MQRIFTATTLLAVVFSPIFGHALSAGDCGPTSITNVPGCWGTPVSYGFVADCMNGIDNDKGCAYVIARNLGPGAACKFDYCSEYIPFAGEASSHLWFRLRRHECTAITPDHFRDPNGRLQQLYNSAKCKQLSNRSTSYPYRFWRFSYKFI